MLQCTPTKCDISNPYCRTGKEGAYCDYEDPDKSRDPPWIIHGPRSEFCYSFFSAIAFAGPGDQELVWSGFDPRIPA